jgi:hypothetical protein
LVARRDIMKLWRASFTNATPHSPLPNWWNFERQLNPCTLEMTWIDTRRMYCTDSPNQFFPYPQ